MADAASRRIAIAGAGIAGLTAALCFARRGMTVDLFERAPELQEVGAGIQLSPNATRILAPLGVLDRLMPAAVVPEAISIRDGASLRELARMPLGADAETRWHAPYLVVHRADLQSALVAAVRHEPLIRLVTGATVRDAAFHSRGVTISYDRNGAIGETAAMLLVGADGVWSTVRAFGGPDRADRFSGFVAWRSTLHEGSVAAEALASLISKRDVTAFLHPGMHLVAYPVRAGAAINLVAVVKGKQVARGWSNRGDDTPLRDAFANYAPALAPLADEAAPWTVWPIHTVDARRPWTAPGGLALIGDAAHAMTPFAAQGAAMAIEDAIVLANLVAASPDDLPAALANYEALRRPRIKNVAARGRFNHFVWHAWGPVALGRDMVLKVLPGTVLTNQIGRHYGYDATKAAVPR